MCTVYVGDEPASTLRREWAAPEGAGELELARAASLALMTFCDGWLEPLVIEALVGCFDHEKLYASAEVRPPKPHWLLHKEPLPDDVRLYHLFDSPVVQRSPRLARQDVLSWLDQLLEQECPDSTCMEPTVLEVVVPTCRVKLPASFAQSSSLVLDTPAGSIVVPVEQRGGDAWVAGPRVGHVMQPPLCVTVANDAGILVLDVSIYWSLWRNEMERPGGDLAEAVRRFEEYDWRGLFA